MKIIKPCPFCGSEVEIVNVLDAFYVRCEKCSALIDACSTKEKVLSKWNKRTPGWISVKEQLPEITEKVLISCKRKGKTNHVFFGFRTPDGWFSTNGYLHEEKVYAWMPLPEPYKKEKDQQETKDQRGEK